MLIDKDLEFSDAQAETTVATHASTNDIDLGVAGDAAKEMYVVISVNTAPTSDGSATINLQLSTSAASNHSSPKILWETGAIAYNNAVFALASKFQFRVPKGALRYLRVNYIIGTAALTAGKFDAFLTPDVDSNEI
jgi:hypothetical protein